METSASSEAWSAPLSYPTSAPWVALQLRQTWAYEQPQRFLIFDRDAKFNADVVATVARQDETGRIQRNASFSFILGNGWATAETKVTKSMACN
jgi:hypothetical protein